MENMKRIYDETIDIKIEKTMTATEFRDIQRKTIRIKGGPTGQLFNKFSSHCPKNTPHK